jgi:RHS repeat-associated protein
MDKPLTITGRGPGSSSNISETVTGFVYGSDGMRAKQSRSVSGVNTSTYYVDKYYEVDSDGSWRAYLDDIAVLSYTPARQHLLHFTLRDRLGSATTMADQNGVVISRRYFDPFGKTTTQSPSASLLENIRRMTYDLDIAKMQDLDVTNKNRRGFTDHEHLNEQQLIHMNGRVYDYNLGRFMSVDPFIQAPTSTQSVNPYSYIMNNPLAGTDPTGYEAEVAETVEVAEKTVLVSSIGSNLRSRVTATVASDGKGGHSVTASGGNGAARAGVINAIAGKLSGAGFQVSNVGSPGDNAGKQNQTYGNDANFAKGYGSVKGDMTGILSWTPAGQAVDSIKSGIEGVEAAIDEYNETGSATKALVAGGVHALGKYAERKLKIGRGPDVNEGTGPYKQAKGHHVHAKAAFKENLAYDPKEGFSISQSFMKENGLDHAAMTRYQRQAFKELSQSGGANTMSTHTRIAVEALQAGGASREMARSLTAQSLNTLRNSGVRTPSNIPWYK